MKISIFTFVGILIFSMISWAGLPAKHILKLDIPSSFSDRTSFPVYIHSNGDSPKAVVFFVAESGCTFNGTQNDFRNIRGLNGAIQEWLLNENYALAVPALTDELLYPQDINQTTRRVQQSDLCKTTNQKYLEEIKNSLKEVSQKYPHKDIYVWGYFYGAYLVNILASEQTKLPQIKGYISTKGWWDSSANFSLEGFAPLTQDPIHNNPAFLSRILVIHSQEDPRIGGEQMDILKKWAAKGAEQNLTVRIYPKGLQIMGYPPGGFPEILIDDLKEFLR